MNEKFEAESPRPPTLRDVARSVGVSVATASAVLNQTKSGTRVSDATRIKLATAAEAMGYRPNELARALFRRRTRLIGFYAQFEHLNAENRFLSELIGGMQDATSVADCDLVLHTIPPDCSPEDVQQSLGDRRVDGLIFFAPHEPKLLAALTKSGLPLVNVVDHSSLAPSVTVNDREGMQIIIRHLVEKGHRKAIYRDWCTDAQSVVDRRQGAYDAARDLGLMLTPGRVMRSDHQAQLLDAELKALADGATAFVCWEDTTAMLTARELENRGLKIPLDVALTGFNGISTAIPLRWNVTTVVAPWREVGRLSVKSLRALIGGQSQSSSQILPVEFRQGDTT